MRRVRKRVMEWSLRPGATRAQVLAASDLLQSRSLQGHHSRLFAQGNRPVIRWIKGDGLDDPVTKAAIGQATRLFGNRVDYCLCTYGIAPERARALLEWADQPVEWWPVSERDNPPLAEALAAAGCPPEHFGYWWKWFPERVRPEGPEWILDGDMVITAGPPWFDAWAAGADGLRVSQDDRPGPPIYGAYEHLVDQGLRLYSGLVSLPPGCCYMPRVLRVLRHLPLAAGHDGRRDMCEQGVIAAALQTFQPEPIPLHQFPFGRAFEESLDHGLAGDQGEAWGYHFGNSFRRRNPHFERLVDEGTVFQGEPGDLIARHLWLGGMGPWGIPGWTMPDGMAHNILGRAAAFRGRHVLEIGTSRGRMTAMLAALGCRVTSVDHVDRGAGVNLEGLGVEVVVDDARHFLVHDRRQFDLIICDIHGNSPADWARFGAGLKQRLAPGGTLLASNAALDAIPEWHEESGVRWFTAHLPEHWMVDFDLSVVPGLAIIIKPS